MGFLKQEVLHNSVLNLFIGENIEFVHFIWMPTNLFDLAGASLDLVEMLSSRKCIWLS